MADRLLTLKEALKLSKKHGGPKTTDTLRKWIRSGYLKAVGPEDGRKKILTSDLMKALGIDE